MQLKHVKYLFLVTLISISTNSLSASAYVKVETLIADYMPDQIRFNVDSNIGTCNSGTWLDRFGNGSDQETKRENNKATYSSLLSYLISGKKVKVYVDESNCQVSNLQFSNQ